MRLLVILVFLASPVFGQIPLGGITSGGGGGGGIAIVGPGSAVTVNSAGSSAATGSIDVASGNLLYCAVGYGGGSGCNAPSLTLSDTGSTNTFTQIGTSINRAYACVSHFYAKNTTAKTGDVITASFGGSVNNPGITCMQVSGVSTTAPLDQSATGNVDASPFTSASFTTTAADEIVFFSEWDFYPGDYTLGNIGGSAATLGPTAKDVTNGAIGIEYRIVSSTLTGQTAAMSKSGSNVYGGMQVATFK